MLELDERIREFIEAGASPVTADEIMAVGQSSDFPTGEVRGRRSGRRLAIYAVVVLAAAAVLVVVGLSIPAVHSGPGSPPASAATILESAALHAQAERPLLPSPGQYLYVRTLVSGDSGVGTGGVTDQVVWYYVQEVQQTWTSAIAPGRSQLEVVGQPQFISGADRAAWQAAGSPPLGSGYGGGAPSPYYNVLGLPTKASKIGTYLASQQDLAPEAGYTRDAYWKFTTAAGFLENGASAAQRAALLRYMADIPGVRLAGQATTIGTKKTGSVLSLPSEVRGLAVQAILDSKTSELFEIRYVYTNVRLYEAATPGLKDETPAAGRVRNYSDFVYAGIANSLGAIPSGAPALPPAWPFGTTREPEPGSLYP